VHQRSLRGTIEMAGQIADAFGQGRIGRRHQSLSTRPRSFFTVERPDFSFSRRSTEPLVGRVFLRGLGGGSAARATSSVRRARAPARFCSWVRRRPSSMTMTPCLVARWPANSITRARTRSERPSAFAALKRSCTAVATLLTFCPPGPEERMKFSSRSSAWMTASAEMMISSAMATDMARVDEKEKARRTGPVLVLSDRNLLRRLQRARGSAQHRPVDMLLEFREIVDEHADELSGLAVISFPIGPGGTRIQDRR